jgi:hypothetical protein
MEIDALEVSQPQNPGDALVRNYKIIGPAPDNHLWVSLDGLELVAKTDFGTEGTATFPIELRNLEETNRLTSRPQSSVLHS